MGYKSQIMDLPLPPCSRLWEHIWNKDSLPKINTFCWIMAHGKLLTNENLHKHGVLGPLKCVLCKSESETNGIFSLIALTKQVWKIAFDEIEHRMITPVLWKEMFTTSHKKYKGAFLNKPILKRAWPAMPKFVC